MNQENYIIRHALLELRVAVAKDFKTKKGDTKLGAVYFIQNCNLSIEKKLHYLDEETDKEEFKQLFEQKRIYVFANPNEVINISETTVKEWNEVIVPVTN